MSLSPPTFNYRRDTLPGWPATATSQRQPVTTGATNTRTETQPQRSTSPTRDPRTGTPVQRPSARAPSARENPRSKLNSARSRTLKRPSREPDNRSERADPFRKHRRNPQRVGHGSPPNRSWSRWAPTSHPERSASLRCAEQPTRQSDSTRTQKKTRAQVFLRTQRAAQALRRRSVRGLRAFHRIGSGLWRHVLPARYQPFPGYTYNARLEHSGTTLPHAQRCRPPPSAPLAVPTPASAAARKKSRSS